jgi:hypothetical protein
VVLSLFAVALPASAHSVAIDTAVSCPSSTPNAGFTDIGAFGADVQLAINCIKAFGITQGTTATTYSPNDTVARWQMALFLVRQAADHGITIPAAASQGYTDISGLPQATQDAINQVTQLGISKGTTSSTFSPNDGVTRWQMALFLRRLAGLAGVTVTDDPAHNQFTDIGAYTAEIQAAINFLADGHIALGTGGSIYDGNALVSRWQMALFLTRVLAADGITQPSSLVTVAPSASASQATGSARTYTATFKTTGGANYTGPIGIQLVEATDAGAPIYNDVADFVNIQATSDGLDINGAGATQALRVADCALATPVGLCDTATGAAGTDGVVTFTIRHSGTAEDTIPVAWADIDGDGTYETVGNVAPTEPFGLGGETDFAAGPAGEGTAAAINNAVTKTTKASDVFEVGPAAGTTCVAPATACSLFYDSGDIFTVGGAAATLQTFEDALSVGDTVTGTYDPDTADQSTFNLTNVATGLAVTDPAAAGVSVDAASYAIKGTSAPGATIRIYTDADNNGAINGTDNVVASGTADADGAWTVTTPLAQNTPNNFTATQQPSGGVESAPVDVPTITESGAQGARLAPSTWDDVAGGLDGLNPTDVIDLNFNETVTAPTAGDTVELSDADATQVRLTCGTEATCSLLDTDTIRVTVNLFPQIIAAGGTAGLQSPAQINVLGGFVGTDGLAVDVPNSPAANRQLTEA